MLFLKRYPYLLRAIAVLMLTGASGFAQDQDPFLPYLTGKPPVIQEDLGTEINAEGLKIHKLVFRSRVVQTPEGPRESLVYAVIVHPPGKGPFPAMVRIHGGGGHADVPSALSSARDGYVSLVLDVPGVAGKERSAKNTINWDKIPKIGAKPDATHSALFDAVLAGIQSFYLLAAQPDVDQKKIGVAGSSWGGYTATMVAGILDRDVAATYSAFGSGNFLKGAYEKANIERLPEEERKAWLKWLDPGARAVKITKPYIIATASNDRHWSWMAVQATLEKMKAPLNYFYSPNDNHQMKYMGSSLMIPFFNQYLKGGPALPMVLLGQTEKLKDGRLSLKYKVKHAEQLIAARVYYTNPTDQPVWTERVWSYVDAKAVSSGYQAIIPASAAAKPLDWYVLVTDHQPKLGKDTVSVSSLIQHLKSL